MPGDRLSQDYGGPGWKGPVRTVPFRLAAVTGQGVMLRCGGHDVLAAPATGKSRRREALAAGTEASSFAVKPRRQVIRP